MTGGVPYEGDADAVKIVGVDAHIDPNRGAEDGAHDQGCTDSGVPARRDDEGIVPYGAARSACKGASRMHPKGISSLRSGHRALRVEF